jgi:hypothetical protein
MLQQTSWQTIHGTQGVNEISLMIQFFALITDMFSLNSTY